MDHRRYQQIKRLFLAALSCPPEERTAGLQDFCGEDEELLDTVERLLDREKAADDFLKPGS